MDATLKGRLLVAMPHLADPNFFRTVVLLLEHEVESGALGVVLNRPSTTRLTEALPSLGPLATEPPVVFVGGPVAPTAAVCLARAPVGAEPPGWTPLSGSLGIVDLSRPFEDVTVGLEAVRVFAGYAGWSPGQLENELEEASWFVLESEPEDVFGAVPDGLWRSVLRRQGGKLALVSTFPLDPTTN